NVCTRASRRRRHEFYRPRSVGLCLPRCFVRAQIQRTAEANKARWKAVSAWRQAPKRKRSREQPNSKPPPGRIKVLLESLRARQSTTFGLSTYTRFLRQKAHFGICATAQMGDQ